MSEPATSFDVFLGIKVVQVVAGLFGGLVRALLAPIKTMTAVVSSCIIGAITAGYLTPLAVPILAKHVGQPEGVSMEPITGFIVGLTAMAICEYVIGRVSVFASKHQAETTPKG